MPIVNIAITREGTGEGRTAATAEEKAQLIAGVHAGKYAGPWSLETFNPRYWEQDPEDVARRGHAAIDALLQS